MCKKRISLILCTNSFTSLLVSRSLIKQPDQYTGGPCARDFLKAQSNVEVFLCVNVLGECAIGMLTAVISTRAVSENLMFKLNQTLF
jgi:hypothetical protein